jgi:hypothetical protein
MTENRPSIELVHSEPGDVLQRRIERMLMDAKMLDRLTRVQAKTIYSEIELARDCLSRILDRADGKS